FSGNRQPLRIQSMTVIFGSVSTGFAGGFSPRFCDSRIMRRWVAETQLVTHNAPQQVQQGVLSAQRVMQVRVALVGAVVAAPCIACMYLMTRPSLAREPFAGTNLQDFDSRTECDEPITKPRQTEGSILSSRFVDS